MRIYHQSNWRPLLALAVALAVVALPAAAEPQRGTQKYEEWLREQVRHQLVMLPYYGVFDYMAYRIDGESVVLLGKVTRPTLKADAERVVKGIEGVRSVKNEIEVLPPSPGDDRLRRALYRSIYGHTNLHRYALRAVPPIHIIVHNGHIALEGVVANETEKNVAGIQARTVPGSFTVTNNLRVENAAKQARK
ncbi:MAG TPA: BON domain-containing protein [Candidatus Acidoferrales bacterium]